MSLGLAVLLGLALLVNERPAVAAGPCGPPVVSVIACENTLPGDPPSDWDVSGAGDSTIQGFATSMSVNVGQTVNFKINTPAASYHIDILRLGWYQGDGARKVVSNMLPTATLPQTQPACINDTQPTGLIDCGKWAVSASWTVPSNAVSGLYLAHLVRNDTGGSSLIPFVVRNDASHSGILFQTDDETWQAYNNYGGNSLYDCTVNCPPGNPAAYKGADAVSYNRPWIPGGPSEGSWLFYAEFPMIEFLEENGYDVSYTSGVDMSQPGAASIIEQHKIFLAAGHDEYWSAQQRANVTTARGAGVNLAFFTGNEVFWKTRFAPSIDGSSTPNRTLVTYKETHYNAQTDPQDPPTWTGSWMDPRFSPPGDGGNPQNSLTGQLFDVNDGTADIKVPSQYSKLRFWRNTRVASLPSGQSTTLDAGVGTLGYEWDVDADNGFRPPGLMDLSSTTDTSVQPFLDYGSTTTTGDTATVTHHLTLYRAPSGALVFGAGTVQWSWGLASGAGPPRNSDSAMQQATVNVFADMGNVQPYSLMAGLTPATPSTDTTPPTSTITSPSQGATFSDGAQTTISGTATDAGGGVVAGVEISTDGGTTWHPVTTMSAPNTSVTWSYSWIAHGSPTTTIKTRAVDDSGNLETPGPGITIQVNCPCSIWGTHVTPTTVDSGDPASTEVGVKFQSDTNGYITGIRFYKAGANTGTHVGNLWTATGQLLASATFTNETASGWQQVNFSQPVAINKGTTYVASYFAPNGHYSEDGYYFFTTPPMGTNPTITNVDSPPLHALRNTNGVTNGVYSYAGSSTFPTSSANASNYYVDPVFSPAFTNPPGPVSNVSASAGNASANVTWSAPTSGDPVTAYTVTPYIGSAAQTPTTVSGTSATVSGLTNGTTYTFTVTPSNPAGSGPQSSPSNAVTPSVPPSVSGVTPSAGSTGNAVSVAPSATFSQPVTPSTVSFTVKDSAGNSVAGSVGFNAADTVATFTPSSSLAAGTTYTATVSGAQNASGTPMSSPYSWSFSTGAVAQCPCSIWQNGTPAGSSESNDPNAQTSGVKFQASSSGFITGVRFYKEPDDTGAHVGSLWSSSGTLLASGTFSNETASGWQELDFSSPVAVTGGTTYVASYFSHTGYPASTSQGLASGVTNGPLTALAGGGVYAYGGSNTFPTNTWNNSNYWVDVVYSTSSGATVPGAPTGVSATSGNASATVSWTAPGNGGSAITSYTVTPYVGSAAQTPVTVSGSPPATSATVSGLTNGTAYTFRVSATNAVGTGPASSPSNAVTPSPPPAVTSVTPSSGATGVAVSVAPSATFSQPVTPSTASFTVKDSAGNSVAGSVGFNAADTVATFTPTNSLAASVTYTATVSGAQNASGTPMSSPFSWNFTTAGPQCPCSIWNNGTPTGAVDSNDPNAQTSGVKFQAASSGFITGVRFYKEADDTGAHVGSLWSSSGTLLASGTFSNETASGWQELDFSSPVAVTAGTTYVASYFSGTGHPASTSQGLASAVTNGPLTALAGGGVYAYGGSNTFPTNVYNANNYWVDVVYSPS